MIDYLELGAIQNNTLQIAELTRISDLTNSDLYKTYEKFSKYEEIQSEKHGKLQKKIDAQKEKINDLEEKLTTQARSEASFDAKIDTLQVNLVSLTHKNKKAIQKDRANLKMFV
jgi:septal ring factor EnvC (AmiA/AmiB activator)